MWLILAFLSAIFASLTSILAKVGIDGVNSNLATAIRTFVVLFMSWFMVFVTNSQSGLFEISKKNWIFLILSSITTGASWLFYFRAMQISPKITAVVALDKLSIVITVILAIIFLNETFTFKTVIGSLLIAIGTLFMVL